MGELHDMDSCWQDGEVCHAHSCSLLVLALLAAPHKLPAVALLLTAATWALITLTLTSAAWWALSLVRLDGWAGLLAGRSGQAYGWGTTMVAALAAQAAGWMHAQSVMGYTLL